MSSSLSGDPDVAIHTERLSKTFRDGLVFGERVKALDEVSLTMPRGVIYGLLGPNGAGKTTLIKILLGIVGRSSGAARLLGHAAGSLAARKKVGYLPEHHRIPHHHTARSALYYYGGLSGLSNAEVKEQVDPLLATVGLSHAVDRPVKKFSKGMLQRLGLAQAMLHDPEMLILDEPTDGVDPKGRADIRHVLADLRGRGKTVFLNSHLLQETELICDHIVILNRGRIQSSGSVEELTGGASLEVQILVAGAEDAVRQALADVPDAHVEALQEGQSRVTMSGPEQVAIDGCVDRLRHADLSIRSLQQKKATLEQAFLEIMETAGA